jgi:lipid-binding SYLF domain-containing protein
MKQSKVSAPGSVITFLFLFSFLAASAPLLAATKEQVEQQKADIQKMANETLERLYTTQPSAKKAINKAAGYAVFSNFGMKIFFAGGGSGKGLAVNNKTGNTTFMKLIEVQAGLGMGVKKFRLIWVFENQGDLDSFINSGWEFGGQATAAAQASGEGGALAGAMSIKPGVWLYQLTDDGLALELTAKGTKYYKDDNLN